MCFFQLCLAIEALLKLTCRQLILLGSLIYNREKNALVNPNNLNLKKFQSSDFVHKPLIKLKRCQTENRCLAGSLLCRCKNELTSLSALGDSTC